MRTLIIYAHPPSKPTGNCFEILNTLKTELDDKSIDYSLIDLYKDKFDPCLQADEHYVSGNCNISSKIKNYQKKIEQANHLIFIFPIWWAGMPAILKGFFEKVLTPGFGYKYEGNIPRKLFKDKKALVFMTAGGPAMYVKVVQGNRPEKNIKNDILGFLGIKTKTCLLSNTAKVDDRARDRIKKLVKKELDDFC